MLKEIRASFSCDECGKPFSIVLDSPYTAPEGWSLFDIAVDGIRGTVGYEGPQNTKGFAGLCAVDKDRHICGACKPTLR